MQDDIVALFTKRVWDIAGTYGRLKVGIGPFSFLTPDRKVYLNDELLKVNSFEAYAKMYLDSAPSDGPRKWASQTIVDSKGLKRWEVLVCFQITLIPDCCDNNRWRLPISKLRE